MKRKNYVQKVQEPLTVYWFAYREDLVAAFDHTSFDNLQKMGYHIWDDVDYDAEDVEAQYEELLSAYKKKWTTLPPQHQSQKLMGAFKLTEDELAAILQTKNYEYFQ